MRVRSSGGRTTPGDPARRRSTRRSGGRAHRSGGRGWRARRAGSCARRGTRPRRRRRRCRGRDSRHTTWLAPQGGEHAAGGAGPEGHDVHAERLAQGDEPLVDVGGLQRLHDDGDRPLLDLRRPEPGPLPAAEVGQGEDGALAAVEGRLDPVPALHRDAGLELVRRRARQAERLDPVAGVALEGGGDGAAQRQAAEVGPVDPPEVALDLGPSLARERRDGGADAPGDEAGHRRRQAPGQGRAEAERPQRPRRHQPVRLVVLSGGWSGRPSARAGLDPLGRAHGTTAAPPAGSGHRPRGAGLAPHLHEPLHGGDGGQHEHHPERGDEQGVEQQAEGEEGEALGPLHEPALGVEPERLGLGPLVADQHRHAQHGEGQDRHPAVLGGGQEPGDAAEQQGVGQAVGDRVEEGAPGRGRAGRLGHRAVEHVGHGAQHEQQEAAPQGAGADRHRRAGGHEHAEGRQVVGGEAGAPDVGADRAAAGPRPASGSSCRTCERQGYRWAPRTDEMASTYGALRRHVPSVAVLASCSTSTSAARASSAFPTAAACSMKAT